MDFGIRLKHLRLDKNLTQKELGSLLDVTEATVGNWERGVKHPGLLILTSLAQVLDVSIDTLAGTQNIVRRSSLYSFLSSPEENTLITQYRKLDIYGKEAVKSICDIEHARIMEANVRKETQSVSNTPTGRETYIPCYLSPSAAGTTVPLGGDEFEMALVDDSTPKNADYIVRIQGDSMEPHIKADSTVYISKTQDISNGDVGIFSVDGAMYCKQYYKGNDGVLYLLSSNPERINSNITLTPDSGSTIRSFGKVILDRKLPLPEYFES
jgi:Predicted transcriptional regulator